MQADCGLATGLFCVMYRGLNGPRAPWSIGHTLRLRPNVFLVFGGTSCLTCDWVLAAVCLGLRRCSARAAMKPERPAPRRRAPVLLQPPAPVLRRAPAPVLRRRRLQRAPALHRAAVRRRCGKLSRDLAAPKAVYGIPIQSLGTYRIWRLPRMGIC